MDNEAFLLVAPPKPTYHQKQELQLPALSVLAYPDVEDLMSFVRNVLVLWLTKAPPAQVNES
jgi:hypothetical protein